MESTQDALTQLMGAIFIIALLYLAIAFSLELMKRRAEIIHLSERSQPPQSFMQSQPMEASRLSVMEPISGWLEHPPAQTISGAISDRTVQTVPSKVDQLTELPGNELLESIVDELEPPFTAPADGEPVNNENTATVFEELAGAGTEKLLERQSAQAESESERTTEQAVAESSSPADAKAELENVWVTIGEPDPFAEETLATLTAELEDFFENQAEMTSHNQIGESPPEGAITPDPPDQEDVWAISEDLELVEEPTDLLAAEVADLFASQAEMTFADQASESPPESAIKPDAPDLEGVLPTSLAAGELPELITAELEDLFPSQAYESITATPEEPSIDQSKPYFTDERESSSALMPSEFEEVWPPVGETPTLAGMPDWFEALEDLFAPKAEAKHLAQGAPTPIEELEALTIEELEALTAVDLGELFASPADVPAIKANKPTPIEELDRPSDDELEEIFGAQLKVESFD